MADLATVADVLDVTDSLGLPATLMSWPDRQAPQPPYVVLVPTESQNLMADGTTHSRARNWDVELYMRRLDMPLVTALEDALDEAGIPYWSAITQSEVHMFALARITTTLNE